MTVSVEVSPALRVSITLVAVNLTVGPVIVTGVMVAVRLMFPAKPELFSTIARLRAEPALIVIEEGRMAIEKSPFGGEVTITLIVVGMVVAPRGVPVTSRL